MAQRSKKETLEYFALRPEHFAVHFPMTTMIQPLLYRPTKRRVVAIPDLFFLERYGQCTLVNCGTGEPEEKDLARLWVASRAVHDNYNERAILWYASLSDSGSPLVSFIDSSQAAYSFIEMRKRKQRGEE